MSRSRYDEIPQLPPLEGDELAHSRAQYNRAYFELQRFTISEVARAERHKLNAGFGWFMAAVVWIPMLLVMIFGGNV